MLSIFITALLPLNSAEPRKTPNGRPSKEENSVLKNDISIVVAIIFKSSESALKIKSKACLKYCIYY